MAILQYQGCYISHTASTVGRIEAEGPLGACFDLIERDPYFGEESWEKAESEMVHRTLNVLLKKAAKKPEEIDLILGGDLLNQCTASTFAVSELKIPFLGLYGACSTAAESLLIGSRFCCGGQTKRAIAFAGLALLARRSGSSAFRSNTATRKPRRRNARSRARAPFSSTRRTTAAWRSARDLSAALWTTASRTPTIWARRWPRRRSTPFCAISTRAAATPRTSTASSPATSARKARRLQRCC